MSDPQRLLVDGSVTDLERDMLASWQRNKPSSAARERTLAMVGLAAGTAVITSTATAGGSIAPKATGAAYLAIAKWLAIGAVAIGSTAAAVAYVRPTKPVEQRTIEVTTPQPRQAEALLPPASVEPTTTPVVSAETPKSARSRAPVRGAEAPDGASKLREQVSLLDRARTALASGDTARSQRLVDEYASRFPDGAFAQEAEVLRIEALLKEGHGDGAASRGARFLADHPTSPHAARVRALVGGASP